MRMMLYLDANADEGVPSEIHPIYEFDLQKALDDGIALESGGYLNRTMKSTDPPQSISVARFTMASSLLYRYFSRDIPSQPDSTGDILQSKISPYSRVNDVYIPDPEYYSFEAVPITADPPEDWGVASNYFRDVLQTITISGIDYTYKRYYNVRRNASWSPGGNPYYKNTNRTQFKIFYTDAGYSFGIYRGGQGDTSGGAPMRLSVGGDARGTSSVISSSNRNIIFTTPTNGAISTTEPLDPQPSSSQGLNGFSLDSPSSNANRVAILTGSAAIDGAAASMAFVHYQYNDPDPDHVQRSINYYGIAIFHHDTFVPGAHPTQIDVIAFTDGFWGASIISGGGGGGSWGPPSIPDGGDGSFTITRQDDRGDPDGHGVADRAADIRSALDPFFTGSNGLRLHQLLSASIPDIYALLYADTSGAFLRRYEQSMYNPLSAILSVHMLPQNLVHFTGVSSDLTASGYNISQNLPTPTTFPGVSQIGSYPDKDGTTYGAGLASFDFDAYFGAYPDFAPYTDIRLHLPYCGVIDIDANLVQHGTLQVSYICDALSGNVAAYVYCKDKDGHATYNYVATGNAALSLPMFAAQQDGSSVGKLGLSLVGIGLGAATGNVAAVSSGIAGAVGAVYDAATAERSTQITGQYSGNIGALTDTVCWLEITRPVWAEPDNYQLLHGETSEIGGTIADYSDGLPYDGYLQVQQIDADGIQATKAEIQEIEDQVKAGIYVNLP